MSNYKLYKNKENGSFEIIELKTNHVIFRNKDYVASHEKYRFLQGGGGFDSWTPKFLINHLTN